MDNINHIGLNGFGRDVTLKYELRQILFLPTKHDLQINELFSSQEIETLPGTREIKK